VSEREEEEKEEEEEEEEQEVRRSVIDGGYSFRCGYPEGRWIESSAWGIGG